MDVPHIDRLDRFAFPGICSAGISVPWGRYLGYETHNATMRRFPPVCPTGRGDYSWESLVSERARKWYEISNMKGNEINV